METENVKDELLGKLAEHMQCVGKVRIEPGCPEPVEPGIFHGARFTRVSGDEFTFTFERFEPLIAAEAK